MLQRLESLIIKIEESLCLFSLITMVMCVALQVASRYLFKTPTSWVEELSRSSLIWLTFMGGSMALRLKAHFVIELLVNKLPKKFHNLFEILLLLIIACLLSVMLYTGIIMLPVVHPQMSSSLGWPMTYVYLSIPMGSAFMLFHVCKFIYQRATGQYIEAGDEDMEASLTEENCTP